MKITSYGILLLVVLLTGSFFSVFAQSKRKFGKVDANEVRMKAVNGYPDAGAVILFDKGAREFDYRGGEPRLVYYRHTQIKILSEAAFYLANVEIPYYTEDKKEIVTEIEGFTYNEAENGEILKLKMVAREQVFEEDVDGRSAVKKFTMANVKVGSVIEYRYKILSYDFYSPRTWYFQSEYPTLYSEVCLGVPDGFEYGSPKVLGNVWALEKKEANLNNPDFDLGTRFTYIARDIPGLDWERIAYAPNRKNYLFRLDWELKRIAIPGRLYKDYAISWKEIHKDLMDDPIYRTAFHPVGALKKELAFVPDDEGDDPMEKASVIYGYLREKLTWNNQHSDIPSQSLAKTLSLKEGNSASINLLMMGMLREAGLVAYPVLISTRKHGVVQQYFPNIKQFNHLIVALEIDSIFILLDGTNNNTGFGILPIKDLNGIGFLISESGYQWINLSTGIKKMSKITVTAELDPEGNLTGTLKAKDSGYGGYFSRIEYFFEAKKDEKTYFYDRWMEGLTDTELEGCKFKDVDNVNKPMTSSCTFSSSDFTNVAGEKMFFNPMTFSGKNENPFKLEERRYPVDFIYPIKEQYLLNLNIPEGYEVEEMPSNARMVLPDKSVSFNFLSNQIGNKIQLISTFEIKKPLFSVEEYPALRMMFDQVVARHGEIIVLKKIN